MRPGSDVRGARAVRSGSSIVVTIALTGLSSGVATAQPSELVGVGLSGAYYTGIGGDALGAIDPGLGVEATVRLVPRRWLTLGAGVRSSRHEIEGTSLEGTYWGAFGELRLIGFGTVANPFGGLRVGYAAKDFDAPVGDDSGAELAAVLGVMAPLMPGFMLEVTGVGSFVLMEDAGSALGLLVGLSFWFP